MASGSASQRRRQKYLNKWAKKLDTEEQKVIDAKDMPKFGTLLKQVYKKSHPDLLSSSHPDLAQVNDQSIQLLNGVLSSVKTMGEFPPQIVQTIPLHLLDPENEIGTRNITLRIETAGGDCQKSLTKSFETFFQDAGVGEKFKWDDQYFETITFSGSGSA